MAEPRGSLREVPLEEWDPLLERLGVADVYLLRDYVAASALVDGGRPLLLHLSGDGGDVVAAWLLRDLPHGAEGCDLVTPYGYGGPLAAGVDPPLQQWGAAFADWARGRGVITAFLRLHPLFENHRHADRDVDLVELAGTIAWCLDAGRDLEAQMHQRHRRSVRKARAAGVAVEVTRSPGSLDRFVAMYELTMERQQASDYYFFPPAYWRTFAGPLRRQVVLADARLDGDVVASLLCLQSAGFLHYHLGASTDAAREVSANVLCFLELAKWGQEHGCSHLHLGGGVGGRDDSLFDFKRRFDPDLGQRRAFIGKQVLDPARYRELAGTDDTSGFFPAYRRPAVPAH